MKPKTRAALDGIELEYEVRGAGEPVVPVHAGGCSLSGSSRFCRSAPSPTGITWSAMRAAGGSLSGADGLPRDRAGARCRPFPWREHRLATGPGYPGHGPLACPPGAGTADGAQRDRE